MLLLLDVGEGEPPDTIEIDWPVTPPARLRLSPDILPVMPPLAFLARHFSQSELALDDSDVTLPDEDEDFEDVDDVEVVESVSLPDSAAADAATAKSPLAPAARRAAFLAFLAFLRRRRAS